MNIISTNVEKTVGVVSKTKDATTLGEFKLKNLEAWVRMARLVLGDDDVEIRFKKSEDPEKPAYMIFASHEGADPMVAVAGTHYADGAEWK